MRTETVTIASARFAKRGSTTGKTVAALLPDNYHVFREDDRYVWVDGYDLADHTMEGEVVPCLLEHGYAWGADVHLHQVAVDEPDLERVRVCIGCEAEIGQPHKGWCPVVTGTLSSLKGARDDS